MPTCFNEQVDLYEPTVILLQFLKVLDKLHGCSSQSTGLFRYLPEEGMLLSDQRQATILINTVNVLQNAPVSITMANMNLKSQMTPHLNSKASRVIPPRQLHLRKK